MDEWYLLVNVVCDRAVTTGGDPAILKRTPSFIL